MDTRKGRSSSMSKISVKDIKDSKCDLTLQETSEDSVGHTQSCVNQGKEPERLMSPHLTVIGEDQQCVFSGTPAFCEHSRVDFTHRVVLPTGQEVGAYHWE